mgnify:CR=1 FL=1
MTQALWVLCLLLLAAGYIADPSGPVLAAGLAALALPVLSWLAVLLCRRKLRAELSCPASAEKGRPAAVRLPNDPATTQIYALSPRAALPIC